MLGAAGLVFCRALRIKRNLAAASRCAHMPIFEHHIVEHRMENTTLSEPLQPAPFEHETWWQGLSDDWKLAFNEVLFQQKNAATPTAEQLETLHQLTVLRLAGPSAMFPNTSIELQDLSGVSQLDNLEILVVANHNLTTLQGLSGLGKLQSLFVFGNRIGSLQGIEALPHLKQLYINDNQISDLTPLAGLVHLETIHCAHNKLTSLEGIGKQHTALKDFFCLPNEGIWNAEILRFETAYRIRCQKG